MYPLKGNMYPDCIFLILYLSPAKISLKVLKKIFNIREFAEYLNVSSVKNEDLHIIDFGQEANVRPKSEPVTIDFFLLAIKPPMDKDLILPNAIEDQANSFMYIDGPHNLLGWDTAIPKSGYTVMVTAKYLSKAAKDYNFVHYNNHEALFLSTEEETILWDLYEKAYHEFQKKFYSREVIISYINLILSYTKVFYDRQFDSRSNIYHQVITDFYKNITDYFNKDKSVSGLPSVAFFAEKANISPNYFGDLIKHFTGQSPIDHIQDFIVQLAKDKLRNTNHSISEISYSLGFDYPNYFARFFRKKTGIAPKLFRSQL